ncbi:MAG: DNA translocase FtsK, partial [bacterium]|nr:DNA translocase FtsK [bacterium]
GGIIAGFLILRHLLRLQAPHPTGDVESDGEVSLTKKIFAPKFKVEDIESSRGSSGGDRAPTARPEKKKEPVAPPPSLAPEGASPYTLPPVSLLVAQKDRPDAGDTRNNTAVIKKTLQNFDIQVEMSEVNIGPTVSQYTFKPAEGVKLSRITSLTNDLSLALARHPVRIEAPIPGRSLVGVEVPNQSRAIVRLQNMIAAPAFREGEEILPVCLGQNVSGTPLYADISRMPHLLVAGSTGSGKTIFLNTLILSLLYKHSPYGVRLILIDPKRVELSVYKGLPHTLCPIIFDAQRAVNALKWAAEEMSRRFELLSEVKSRDILSYNQKAIRGKTEPLPYIVIVIDELADLMVAKGKEVEVGVVRIAQMARAVGIHLVVATQRPSVEVITGLIKANIPTRISFQVAS